mgnify:CR=1 FL=1
MLKITQDLLNRYVAGTASLEEMAAVTVQIKKDKDLACLVGILESLRDSNSLGNDEDIPMSSLAAMSEGNLCDVMCEKYILKDYQGADSAENCLDEALDNCWLKEAGTPLHNMGRLLESHGMSVVRKYDCTISEIESNLSNKRKVIAVVDYGQLWNEESDGIFHAVVCVSTVDGMVRIYDPAIDGHTNYSVSRFKKAWDYSKNYLVVASSSGLEYHPHPINVDDVILDNELLELTEAIAENAHEVWAYKRQSEGWKFGPKRDDTLLEHPDLVPYCELTEGEKYYDRALAMNTIRLVKKLGFNITRRYTKYCQCCGEYVSDEMKYCPNCGSVLHEEV